MSTQAATQPGPRGSVPLGSLINQRARAAAEAVAWQIAYPGVTPNLLSILGFVLTLGVALVIASGYEVLGGLLVIAAGLFDMLDGALARVNRMKTQFGAFLDSTLDRLSEATLLGGILWAYPETWTALLVLTVLTGSLLVSYTRARAEGLGIDCEIGLLPRPWRVVILSTGLILGLVVPALVILAVFTHVTTVQRILHVRHQLGSR